jgi:hypothetical protein
VPAPGAGTIEDLLKDARKAGYPVTSRLVTDWVSVGLLDSPARHGVGRGKGTTKGAYSGNQRQLFLELLKERPKWTKIAPLTNVPIAWWAYFGDEYVPLRQVKRALDTWIKAADRSSPARSRLATQELVKLIESPDARDIRKRRLLRLLDQANAAGRVDDPAALQEAIQEVFDPKRTGRTLAPAGASISPEVLVYGMVLNSGALKALREHRVTDQTFEQARADLRQGLAGYLGDHPLLITSAEASVQHLFSAPLLQQFMSNACGDLVTAIGHQLTRKDGP